ncbi:MAG: hypothetical protein Q9225_006861 [Loekoesia sp. 1 TL-2023]
MDPATIIGTTAAIVGIVDVVARSISTLRGIRSRWEAINLEISNLITQLNSLKAALNKISEWISSDLMDVPQHYQLVIDLDEAIVCCRVLVKSINDQIEHLSRNEVGSLDLPSKIQVFLRSDTFAEFQKFIDRQIGALNLLLIACNCKTISEQKAWLEKQHTRAIFDQTREDSSSLIVLRDSASRLSGTTASTGNSTKWSMVFSFDGDLMRSQVYQRAIRRLFKRSVSPRFVVSKLDQRIRFLSSTADTKKMLEVATKKSEAIEYQLIRDKRLMSRNVKCLLTGGSDSDLQAVMWRLQADLSLDYEPNIAMLRTAVHAFGIFQQKLIEQKLIGQLQQTVIPAWADTEASESATTTDSAYYQQAYKQAYAVAQAWQEWPKSAKEAADPSLK